MNNPAQNAYYVRTANEAVILYVDEFIKAVLPIRKTIR
jgi:hypothetical protein